MKCVTAPRVHTLLYRKGAPSYLAERLSAARTQRTRRYMIMLHVINTPTMIRSWILVRSTDHKHMVGLGRKYIFLSFRVEERRLGARRDFFQFLGIPPDQESRWTKPHPIRRFIRLFLFFSGVVRPPSLLDSMFRAAASVSLWRAWCGKLSEEFHERMRIACLPCARSIILLCPFVATLWCLVSASGDRAL